MSRFRLLSVAGMACALATPSAAEIGITGRIFLISRYDSLAIPGATVVLNRYLATWPGTIKSDTAYTDSAGTYRLAIERVPGDSLRWQLMARKDGFYPNDKDIWYRTPDPLGSSIRFDPIQMYATPPDRILKFTVLLPDSLTPAAGAKASLFGNYSTSSYEPVELQSVTADSGGQVTIIVKGGTSHDFEGVAFDAPGALGARITVRTGNADVRTFDGTSAQDTIRLRPQGKVIGTARTPQGEPIPGLLVTLARAVRYPGHAYSTFAYGASGEAYTGPDGTFAVPFQRTYFNRLCELQTPRPDTSQIYCPEPGETLQRDIQVASIPFLAPFPGIDPTYGNPLPRPRIRITGNLLTPQGVQIAEATVMMAYLDPQGKLSIDSTLTDKLGQFTLITLAYARGNTILFMEARKAGYFTRPLIGAWMRSIDIENGIAELPIGTTSMLERSLPDDVHRLKLQVTAPPDEMAKGRALIRFGCIDSASGPAEARSVFYLASLADVSGQADISFAYPLLDAGAGRHACEKFVLTAETPGYGAIDTSSRLERFSAGDTLALLPLGRIHGIVTDSTGKPAAGRKVYLRAGIASEKPSDGTNLGGTETDSLGRFLFITNGVSDLPDECHVDDGTPGQHNIPCPAPGQDFAIDLAWTPGNHAAGDMPAAPRFLLRREAGAGGSDLWILDVPYDQCAVRIASPDGTILFQGRLDKGIRPIRPHPARSARMLLLQWSARQGQGRFKVAAF